MQSGPVLVSVREVEGANAQCATALEQEGNALKWRTFCYLGGLVLRGAALSIRKVLAYFGLLLQAGSLTRTSNGSEWLPPSICSNSPASRGARS